MGPALASNFTRSPFVKKKTTLEIQMTCAFCSLNYCEKKHR